MKEGRGSIPLSMMKTLPIPKILFPLHLNKNFHRENFFSKKNTVHIGSFL